MQAHESKFAIKLLPSLADFAFLMPMAFLFLRMDGLKTLLGDCDTGWHIRTGEWILAHHAVPAHDIFSFSKAGDPWFAWEWLSDVVLAWLNGHGGLRAVALFAIVMLSAIFVLLFHLLRRKANPITALAVTMLAAAASSIHWLARPHLFTLLFLVVFYGALERVQEGHTRFAGLPYLALLPVATIVWTNLHGGFFVGVLMIAAYGLGETLEIAFAPDAEGRPAAWQRARNYFLSAAACLAASLINPYGYRLHAHMLAYLRDPWNSQHIMEFLSPSFHHPTAVFFEAMLALAAATAIWNISKGRFTQPLLMVVWAHAALLAARNIPIFTIAAALPVAAAVQQWQEMLPASNVAGWLRKAADRFNRIAAETAATDSIGRWHLVSALGFGLVAAVICAPHPPKKFRAEFDPQTYPAAALATLRRTSGRVFTYDQWGDYLIWSLYPHGKVFVDGRSDFYGDDFERDTLDVLNVKYDWGKTLARYGVDTILLPPSAPLAGALKESRNWRVVYDDGVALVFRSAARPSGPRKVAAPVSASSPSGRPGGGGRDREVTKTQASDPPITPTKTKA